MGTLKVKGQVQGHNVHGFLAAPCHLYIEELVRHTWEEVTKPPSRESQEWLCNSAFFSLSPDWHCLLSLEAAQELELLHGEVDFPPLVWFLNKTGGCTERWGLWEVGAHWCMGPDVSMPLPLCLAVHSSNWSLVFLPVRVGTRNKCWAFFLPLVIRTR